MSHEKQWGGPHPGCLIVLIDQSGSMEDPFGGTRIGAGKKKCEAVALVLNSLLNELVRTNTVGSTIKPRADIAVLGYHEQAVENALPQALTVQDFVSLPQLMTNPLRVDVKMKKELDETGKVVELPESVPVWVEPVAKGGTPMCAALKRARELAEQWATKHPDNYPPVVMNITDGEATDGDITGPAKDLASVHTTDGSALLFNCHITEHSFPEVQFPESEGKVPDDPKKLARLLYSVSSELPDSALKLASLPSGARGFIFNGDADSIRQMFIFATIPGTGAGQDR